MTHDALEDANLHGRLEWARAWWHASSTWASVLMLVSILLLENLFPEWIRYAIALLATTGALTTTYVWRSRTRRLESQLRDASPEPQHPILPGIPDAHVEEYR